MAIEVDLTSVRRFWVRYLEEVRLGISADFGPHEPDAGELRQRATELRERLDQSSPDNRADAEGVSDGLCKRSVLIGGPHDRWDH
jgi:hypothetical protein